MRAEAPSTPSVDGAPTSRLQSIDGLRGIAALAVVMLHASNTDAWLDIGGPILWLLWQVVQHGGLGVALFFVISGFCIHQHSTRQRARGEPAGVPFGPFWRRRFRRLYPPYLAALAFSMSIVTVRWMQGQELTYPTSSGRWLAKDFVVHALMLHGLAPAYDVQGGNTVYWTLAREEYLYALYFPLLALRERTGAFAATACVLLIGFVVPPVASGLVRPDASTVAIAVGYGIGSDRSAVTLWIQWCLGFLAVEQYFGMARQPRWMQWLVLAPLWAFVALAAPRYGLRPLVPIAWGMAFVTLLNWAVARESTLRESPVWTMLARVGVFSYSLYLIHLPTIEVLHSVERMARRALSLERAAATTTYQLVLWLAGIATACLVARVFFHFVERPFLRRRSALSGECREGGSKSHDLSASGF